MITWILTWSQERCTRSWAERRGKTTLMNLLYGLYQPARGNLVNGQRALIRSPAGRNTWASGWCISTSMWSHLTVSQNITLGLKEKGYPFTDRAAVDRRIAGIAQDYGLGLDPASPVSSLSVGEQQRVEIMKLLYRDARLLILDEPTAVLTPQEAERLFEVLRSLCKRGCAVILITHRIPEVMRVADRVTVLRDTKKVVTAPISALDEEALARHMIGRPLSPVTRSSREASQAPGLRSPRDPIRAGLKSSGMSRSTSGRAKSRHRRVDGTGRRSLPR